MELTIDTREIEDLSRRYAGAGPIIEAELKTAMTRSVIQIEADAKRLVPTDTHHLQRSITHHVTAAGRSVEGRVGTNMPYGRYVEEGTRPHFPPPAALEGWARRHGFPAKGGAYLVARAIARRGTRKRPYLKPALQKNRAAITREFDQVAKRVLAKIGGR